MSVDMQDWFDNVDAKDKKYVEAIAKEMRISVKSPLIASADINADVNNDGYVDLSDILIVRNWQLLTEN